VAIYRPKRRPLLEIEAEYRRLQRMNGVQLVFEIVIDLFRLATGCLEQAPVRPLSPAMRQEVRKLDETLKQYKGPLQNGPQKTRREVNPEGLASRLVCVKIELCIPI
jgi:hypothetical protein